MCGRTGWWLEDWCHSSNPTIGSSAGTVHEVGRLLTRSVVADPASSFVVMVVDAEVSPSNGSAARTETESADTAGASERLSCENPIPLRRNRVDAPTGSARRN